MGGGGGLGHRLSVSFMALESWVHGFHDLLSYVLELLVRYSSDTLWPIWGGPESDGYCISLLFDLTLGPK